MSKNSDRVKLWRKNTKDRIVKTMGSKCVICGYTKCTAALEVHHLDPTKKDFSLGSKRASACSWEKVVVELRKGVLLCSNCHREVHAGVSTVPKSAARFDEKYADYRALDKLEKMEPCPVCSDPKPPRLITCSKSCAAKRSRKVDWSEVDLPTMLQTMSPEVIGDVLGVSGAAVRKQCKKRLAL